MRFLSHDKRQLRQLRRHGKKVKPSRRFKKNFLFLSCLNCLLSWDKNLINKERRSGRGSKQVRLFRLKELFQVNLTCFVVAGLQTGTSRSVILQCKLCSFFLSGMKSNLAQSSSTPETATPDNNTYGLKLISDQVDVKSRDPAGGGGGGGGGTLFKNAAKNARKFHTW